MAKTEGEPLLDPEEEDTSLEAEEIALSDSELDNVLQSAEVTDEFSAEEAENLEQYGVWVKAEPQDVEEQTQENMSFELSDLESGDESALTEEEEQLLGELEEESDSDLGDLSGLEEDLEELGKGGEFVDAEEEEELTVEDLDVDLDELEQDTLPVSDDEGPLEGIPDLDSETSGEAEQLGVDLDREAEIEVPLSDSAVVEEHYEDLASMEGVPSTPGQAPPKASSDILEKIERDLNQIKAEIQSLKNELAGIGKGRTAAGKVEVKPAPADSDGFFQKGEDETIALTGDELDNILNTADVTEEMAGPEETLESLEEELPELPELGEQEQEEPKGEQIMELGSLDLEEEEIPAAETEGKEEGLVSEEEKNIEIEIGEKGGLEEEELGFEEQPEEGLDEISLEGLEEGELDVSEDLELGEEAELEAGTEELEELSLEEPTLDEAGEPSLEEEQVEPLLEEAGTEELEELSLEELPDIEAAEALGEDETAVEELDELEAEEGGAAELELAAEDLAVPQESVDLEIAEFQEAGEPESRAATEALPSDLQSDIKSVLSYLDQLLEALPEDKIKEFAQSEYFGIYKRLFEELGLGA